jgi:hypothetical protein
MKVAYDIKDANLRAKAEHATRLFEDVAGPSAAHMNASWIEFKDNNGRVILKIQVRDPWTEQATADFAPAELAQDDHLRGRFYRLWGDLLQSQSGKLVRELREAKLAGD